jgi:hypothetical protein
MDGPMVRVTLGDEQAVVYGEGGIGFRRRVRGVGWVVCERPGVLITRLALAVRAAAFPALERIGVADVEG